MPVPQKSRAWRDIKGEIWLKSVSPSICRFKRLHTKQILFLYLVLWSFSQISVLSLGCFGELTAEEVIWTHEISVSIEDRLLFLKRNRWMEDIRLCGGEVWVSAVCMCVWGHWALSFISIYLVRIVYIITVFTSFLLLLLQSSSSCVPPPFLTFMASYYLIVIK